MTSPPDLPSLPSPCPPTFCLFPNFISDAAADILLSKIASAPLPKWRELSARRLQIWGGQPTEKGMIPEPLPEWCSTMIDSIADLGVFGSTATVSPASSTSTAPVKPNHILINEYLAGQGILKHTDGPLYNPCVTTLSIGSTCVLDFDLAPQDEEASSKETTDTLFWTSPEGTRFPAHFAVFVPKNSLYCQLDPLYSNYLHGIAERDVDRLEDYCLNLEDYAAQKVESGIEVKKLLLNPWQGNSVIPRETRVSLTFRVVKKVLKSGALKGLFGGKK